MMKFIAKISLSLLVLIICFAVLLLFLLPGILSSNLAREKIADYLAKELLRPVSIAALSFSWNDGLGVSDLTVNNKDGSPFLHLKNLRVTMPWANFLTGSFVIKTIRIDAFDFTLLRDKAGQTNIDDLLEGPSRIAFIPVHSAVLRDCSFSFIDQRIGTTTGLKNLSLDLSLPSFTDPVTVLLKSDLSLNDKQPEPVSLALSANLFADGKFDFQTARGTLDMQSGFATMKASFDLGKFNTAVETTGATLDCSVNLKQLSDNLGGLLGFPPGFVLQGQVTANIVAQGTMQSRIAVSGKSRLSNLIIKGGPFKTAPFSQPQIDFSQDILLKFPENTIELKKIVLQSDFLNLTSEGTISDFKNNFSASIKLSGNGSLPELTRGLGNVLELPPDLKLGGGLSFDFLGQGGFKTLAVKGQAAARDLRVNAEMVKGAAYSADLLEIKSDILINMQEKSYRADALSIRSDGINADLNGTYDSKNNIDMQLQLDASLGNLKKQLTALLPSIFPDQGRLSSSITFKGNLNRSIDSKGEHVLENIAVHITDAPATGQTALASKALSFARITATHDVDYKADQDSAAINLFKADASSFGVEGSGSLSQIVKDPYAKGRIKVNLALAEMQKVLKDFLPDEITLQGKGGISFNAEGGLKTDSAEASPLSTWNGGGSVSLDSIEYTGIGMIQNLRTMQLVLEKGMLRTTAECMLNGGSARLQGTANLSKSQPGMKVALTGNEINLSQDIKVLGYLIPILIMSPDATLTGKGKVNVEAAWQGLDWSTEIAQTISGQGKVSLHDGSLYSKDVLSLILKAAGKSERLQFKEILVPFRLENGRVINDNVQVNGKDVTFGLKGWTSLVYDDTRKGNPLEYTITGDLPKKVFGKDVDKILSPLGLQNRSVPVLITGTVQKPKISIKQATADDLLRGLLDSLKEKQ